MSIYQKGTIKMSVVIVILPHRNSTITTKDMDRQRQYTTREVEENSIGEIAAPTRSVGSAIISTTHLQPTVDDGLKTELVEAGHTDPSLNHHHYHKEMEITAMNDEVKNRQ